MAQCFRNRVVLARKATDKELVFRDDAGIRLCVIQYLGDVIVDVNACLETCYIALKRVLSLLG